MMDSRPNEITLIFHSDKEGDEKTRVYIETLEAEGFVVNTIDLKIDGLTQEEAEAIVEMLDVGIDDLFDQNYVGQLNNDSLKGLDKQSALRLLAKDPVLMATPILIIGEHAYQFESS